MTNNKQRQAIITVLTYIDQHRDEELSLEQLSNISGLSKFYLHRIFKEYMGLALGDYIKLKRLEKGMWKLILTNQQTLDIAFDAGYENHAAFSRAFKKEMGCTPKEFRISFANNQRLAMTKLNDCEPEFLGYQEVADIDIIYVRKTGSYFNSANLAFEELALELRKHDLNLENQTLYGITHDDPNAESITEESMRFDACIEASNVVLKKEKQLKATLGKIVGGSFAVFLHQGPWEKIGDSYHYIYGKWIFDHDVTLRDVRPFFKYRDPFKKPKNPEAIETEIYIPIA